MLYRLTGSVFTLLYQFDPSHGCFPSPLVLGTDGNLYGTAYSGGTFGLGAVFKVTLHPGKAALVNVLYNFDGPGGVYPNGTLVQGNDGNFYGTTLGDFTTFFGTIFNITPTGTLTVLHTLNGGTDGRGIFAGLVQATDGNFYGTAADEGGTSSGVSCASSCGTLFQITPAGSFSVLYNFDGTTGSAPQVAPFQHTNGLLYGDTLYGGTGGNETCGGNGCGIFYSWDAGLQSFVSTVPFMGNVGHFVEILGQGFTSATTVSFNGTSATATVVSGTYLKTIVPTGATTGFITVTTSSGALTSNRQFVVTP